jgi:hypothetical protein
MDVIPGLPSRGSVNMLTRIRTNQGRDTLHLQQQLMPWNCSGLPVDATHQRSLHRSKSGQERKLHISLCLSLRGICSTLYFIFDIVQ